MAYVLRMLLLLLLLAASSAALLATSAHSSCPGPLTHTVHSTFMFAASFAPLCGLASPRTRTRRLAHPLPRTELARLLALVFPCRCGTSGAENRSTGDPQASEIAHGLRTHQRSAPETQLASSSALSRGRPPTPTRTLVYLGAAPYNRSRVSAWDFLLHQGLPLTHRESSRASCPQPANLSVGCLQSRGQPQTSGHDPPWNLKTKVLLDSRPFKAHPPAHHLSFAERLPCNRSQTPSEAETAKGAVGASGSRGTSGAENRSTGEPQASGIAHRLRTHQRSAPKTRLAFSSALSRGRPPTPTRTLVYLGAAPYNRSRVSAWDFLLHQGLPLTHRESSRASCPQPANLSVGCLQSRGQPQTSGHDPPWNLKTKVLLDSRPFKVEAPLIHGPSRRSRQKPIEPHLVDYEAGVCAEPSLIREQQAPHSKSPSKLHLPARPPSNLSAPDGAFGGGLPLACPQNTTCARPPAFSSFCVPKMGSPLSQGKPPARQEAHLHFHSPADPPSRPSSTDPSPLHGQRPAPAPPPAGPHPHAGRKPHPELSLGVPQVLVCLWPLAPLFSPWELARGGCFLVEEKYLSPAVMPPTSARSSRKQRPELAEGDEGGLEPLPEPPGNLCPHWLPDPLVVPQPPEREGLAPAAPYPQQQFNHSVRPTGDREIGAGEPPGYKEARRPHPGGTNPRPLAPMGLGLPPRGPDRRLSAQVLVAASLGDRLGNASASWLALGAVQGVVPLVVLSAEVLMGRGPEDHWPGTRFSRLFWCCVSWGVLVLWRVLSRGREGCPVFEQESLEEPDAEQGTRGHVPGEPQAPHTEDWMAELGLLRDRFSHLDGEVEVLQEHAELLRRQEARVRELEGCFLTIRGLLEACAPGQVTV
ncbi:uncharacterized protein LOC129562053 [Moschus berezovskii]|uniref:uncharacterized protein LOC129562053 n=1 Tax=Moschus berezovskii TaxID=68408 RepID=UPI002444F9B0|nr:uncharacterized protein LOC129562053 [Moschus berezovskii]